MNEHDLWPLRWRGPPDGSAFRLLQGTPINCLVVDSGPKLKTFAEEARKHSVEVRVLGGPDGVPAARPIHLGIIDGIATMNGAEGPWGGKGKAVRPGVSIVGTNPVCTDAVGAAVMGFDPMAIAAPRHSRLAITRFGWQRNWELAPAI